MFEVIGGLLLISIISAMIINVLHIYFQNEKEKDYIFSISVVTIFITLLIIYYLKLFN